MSKVLARLFCTGMGVLAVLNADVSPTNPSRTPQKTVPLGTSSQPAWLMPIDIPLSPEAPEDEIAQASPAATAAAGGPTSASRSILINFNNVSIIEYIRFISRVTNKNFVFDENDLQFTVTIISEEPATVENIMTALVQVLRIHNLTLIEEGNNVIIHNNLNVNNISRVVAENIYNPQPHNTELITQVFRLNTIDPTNAANVITPLVSSNALVEVLPATQHLIVTDVASNVHQIALLLKSLDSPNSGLVIGQYVSKITNLSLLIDQTQRILQPIAQDQSLTFVAHSTSNSIFIVSTPFLVEKSISIMQFLDRVEGATRIIDLKNLELAPSKPAVGTPGLGRSIFGPNGEPILGPNGKPIRQIAPDGTIQPAVPKGRWMLDENGNLIYIPDTGESSAIPPSGIWKVDGNGQWYFIPSSDIPPDAPPYFFNNPNGLQGPAGEWIQKDDGSWVFRMFPGESDIAAPANAPIIAPPVSNQFYIHKLLYRRGEEIQTALQNIASSLQTDLVTEDLIQTKGNSDLINALTSVQWLETTNSLVITGVPDALQKVKYLIEEIDTPLRQVFIEVLVINTTLDDSLTYGVNWGTRFGGGDISGSQGFTDGASPLQGALDTTGITTSSNVSTILIPNGTQFAKTAGFNCGVIGQAITHGGTIFHSLGVLVDTLHDRTYVNIIMNPKIITEDNNPAEIFVGINTNFKTQSISNDQGSIVTNNFEFRDVGTKLKVTPYLGPTNLITLDIAQEISSIAQQQSTQSSGLSDILPGPTTNVNRTVTRVHIPDGYFLILSGMIQEEAARRRGQVPCLGSAPVVGAGFSRKVDSTHKRNILIFVRPKIVDSIDEIQNITKHQQDVWFNKRHFPSMGEEEVDEALDWMNVRPRDPWNGCCAPCKRDILRVD